MSAEAQEVELRLGMDISRAVAVHCRRYGLQVRISTSAFGVAVMGDWPLRSFDQSMASVPTWLWVVLDTYPSKEPPMAAMRRLAPMASALAAAWRLGGAHAVRALWRA